MREPETFSSELGGVHERPGDRPSFTNEFRGASDSLIERERPPHPLDVGRRGRRIVFVAFLIVALLGGGGFAFWYWSAEIGEWIAGWNPSEAEPDPREPEPEPSEPVEPAPPAEPEQPPKVFGVKGAPEGYEPEPTPTPAVEPTPVEPPTPGEALPVEPLDQPPPASKPASVTVASTSVRGKVASASVSSRLAAVDEALRGCWAGAAAQPGTRRPATVTLRFAIKWNGRSMSISVDGDAPDSVQRCAREALPSGGWPQPRDGGDAQVSRTWTLE